MAHPNIHAVSSAKKFGGIPEDYLHIHEWFDETKAWIGHTDHRIFRHHSEGIFECESKFGKTFLNSDGKTDTWTLDRPVEEVKKEMWDFIQIGEKEVTELETKRETVFQTLKDSQVDKYL